MNHMPRSKKSTTEKENSRAYVIEFKHGPDKEGPGRCLYCGKRFAKDDSWQLSWDPDHLYAVGIHDRCLVAKMTERDLSVFK